ncbi:hypothetical protein ESCOCK444M_23220 [Escherichia coli]|nr:hypothetical protein WP9S17E11_P10240 [Escherichia coli]STM42892.1 Uncharacterised protein [Escherichia coli]
MELKPERYRMQFYLQMEDLGLGIESMHIYFGRHAQNMNFIRHHYLMVNL